MDDKNRELDLQARYERRIEEIMKALDEIRGEHPKSKPVTKRSFISLFVSRLLALKLFRN